VKPKGKGWFTKPSAAKLSIAQLEIARRLSSFPPESIANIKRLVRNALRPRSLRAWRSNEISF